MSTYELLVSIGSLSTAISVIIVVLTYINATIRVRNKDLQEKAISIRSNLQKIIKDVQEVQTKMNEGIPILIAASELSKKFEEILPSHPTLEDLNKVLENDKILLSVSISSWYRNDYCSDISKSISNLRFQSSILTGGFLLFSEAVDLMSSIATDGYSPLNFYRILTHYKDFYEINFSNSEIRPFLNELVINLQSNASAYYLARYDKALKEIRKFIEEIGETLISLSDKELYSIPSMKLNFTIDTVTRTNSFRQQIRVLEDYIPNETKQRLLGRIDNIEVLISKEHASHEIEEIMK